ncbi:MAG TPA: hypothetical protein VFZ91_15970 [Allosphingosinicella sp.]
MYALIFSMLGAMMPASPSSDPATGERTILVRVEEMPRSGLKRIMQEGSTADGTATFKLSIKKLQAPSGGSAVDLTVGQHRFDTVRLTNLPFEDVDFGRVTTHSRIYPHGRVFRVHIRYGDRSPHCQIGDDGSGHVSITYRKDAAPEIDHRPPAKC